MLLAVDVGDEQRLALPPSESKQVRQLRHRYGVCERPLEEGPHDLLKVGERLVDVHALVAQVAEGVGLLEALGAGKVDQVELALGHDARRVHTRPDLDVDCEDGVAARRGAVELVVGDLPIRLPLEEQREGVLLGADGLHAQILDRSRPILIVYQCSGSVTGSAVGSVEKIDERVLIDLHVRNGHRRLELRGSLT